MRIKTLALLTAVAFAGTAGSAFAADKMGASGSPCNTTAAAQQTTTGTGPAGTNEKVQGSGGQMAKSATPLNSAKGSQDVTTGSGPAGSNNDKVPAATGRTAGQAADC
jgi:hypothetical protein